ncbi:hypothetical protein SAMN05216570_1409 [Dyella sp. OK004]|uniref:hypothetical protein n=1 Tax=Dyella sp. OK004 TaxID=1855292 RepID=UPI0008EFBB3B|nr:hypothetical protein [Dyella sp. OK004]SFS00217.1 hypothetical protein SAMN05216570_1409 [Dyella sp. OK004]
MYTPNQTNSLYFHPHKLHFTPLSDAEDSELRNRWFPGYDVSVVSPRANAPLRQSALMPAVDPPEPDRYRQDMDANRMDDDGAPLPNADPRDF